MPDLFVLPPKQKLKTAVDNDIVRRVGMIQEMIMDRDGVISACQMCFLLETLVFLLIFV